MLWYILPIILIIIDQLTKYIALQNLTTISTYPIIQGVFHFTYVENRGAAFGILSNGTWLLSIISIIAIVIIIYLFHKKTTNKDILFRTSLMLILAGAAGNLIDRLFLGFVVDFIDFRLINFYVFNVADVCVCVGTFLMFCYYVFVECKKTTSKEQEKIQ